METKDTVGFDTDALCGALRALGLLCGTELAPAALVSGAANEAEAICAYILRERPHLLASYDLVALVALVRTARCERFEAPAALEQFVPA